jgi:hypothetical protein
MKVDVLVKIRIDEEYCRSDLWINNPKKGQ